MATNNAINTGKPIELLIHGGTGRASNTQYGVLYGDTADALGVTAAGTDGYVLTSNGAGAAPTFQPVSSGNLALIQRQDITSLQPEIVFQDAFSASFTSYMFIFHQSRSSNAYDLYMQFSTDNGATYLTTGYKSALTSMAYSSSGTLGPTTATDAFLFSSDLRSGGTGSAGQTRGSGNLYLYNVGLAAVNSQGEFWNQSKHGVYIIGVSGGICSHASVASINSFKLFAWRPSVFGQLRGIYCLYGVTE